VGCYYREWGQIFQKYILGDQVTRGAERVIDSLHGFCEWLNFTPTDVTGRDSIGIRTSLCKQNVSYYICVGKGKRKSQLRKRGRTFTTVLMLQYSSRPVNSQPSVKVNNYVFIRPFGGFMFIFTKIRHWGPCSVSFQLLLLLSHIPCVYHVAWFAQVSWSRNPAHFTI